MANENNSTQVLKAHLEEWIEPDLAAYHLACALGIIPPEDGSYTYFRTYKHMFWSANQLGETLAIFLFELVKCKVLEYDEEAMKLRWNKAFEPTPGWADDDKPKILKP